MDGRDAVKDLSLGVERGEVAILIGPNGAGKSTLLNAILGFDNLKVSGSIFVDGKDYSQESIEERAKKIFVLFQNPPEIEGVPFMRFLKLAYESQKGVKISISEFKKICREKLDEYGLSDDFLTRNLYEGFSGGEKKKAELGSLAILVPDYALLDEPDSGLDIESRKLAIDFIEKLAQKGTGVLLISHYPGFAKKFNPKKVYVMRSGEIVKHGSIELLDEVSYDRDE